MSKVRIMVGVPAEPKVEKQPLEEAMQQHLPHALAWMKENGYSLGSSAAGEGSGKAEQPKKIKPDR